MDSAFIEQEFIPQYAASLVDQVVEFLTNAIIEGRYKSGERLVEAKLQQKFGISRAPIREALLILEKNGLLTSIPRKGRFVRKIITKDLKENFVIRANLESLAARLGAVQVSAEDIKKMELALLEMTRAAKKNDYKKYYKFHYEFHDIFIQASRNDTLIAILENLRRQTIWFRYSNPSTYERSYEYLIPVHGQILDLFIKKDFNELEKVVKEHILYSIDGMLLLLATRSKETQMAQENKGLETV